MTQGTPHKRDVLQVPSSSPISDSKNGASSQTDTSLRSQTSAKDDRQKSEMRKRFYAHKFWPIISKRFYYLTEPELFKAMVKGKGNLRDISQWLAENVPLNERLQRYDASQQAQRVSEDQKRQDAERRAAERKMVSREMDALPQAHTGAELRSYGATEPALAEPRTVDSPKSPAPKSYADDEDASPVKAAGKARQKRSVSATDAKPAAAAPDTKVHLSKPKVSILEKYRQRKQPSIDYHFQRSQSPTGAGSDTGPGAVDVKRRRLVRATNVADDEDDKLVITDAPKAAGSTFLNSPANSRLKKAELLSKTFKYSGEDAVPVIKKHRPSDAMDVAVDGDRHVTIAVDDVDDVDELDALEEKIRANRKKSRAIPAGPPAKAKTGRNGRAVAESDGELEEEVFSDDMSAEEDDAYSSGLTSIDTQILEFLNQAPVDDIAEISNVPPAVAEIIVSKRPFSSIYEISEEPFEADSPAPSTKRKYTRKPLGMKIIERTEFSLKGYRAVDSLVKKCSEYGKLISRQMGRWGVKVTGEGELDMVDIGQEEGTEDDIVVVEDSKGAGGKEKDEKDEKDNSFEIVDDDDDDDDVDTARRGLSYVRHKPTLLAPEVELKNYQQVGINWLHLLYHHKLSCILADEMGLGKTCQVISFMAYLKSTASSTRPHLVVVPSSTLENWLREFQKFCPDLVVQAYYGSQGEREDLRYELAEAEFDVLVTTYNLATGAASDFKFLKSQNFDMIVYDEGHMLKNSASERYTKLMRLKAGFRLLLTGTPLQNNLKELVSLLAFMLPDLFVEKREDLQGLFDKKAILNNSKEYNPLLSQQAINKAKTMMTPFVLRRKKAQVLKHLPQKRHQVVKCDMSATQRAIYTDYIEQGKQAKMERERRKALTGKAAEDARMAPVQSPSNVMMSLRKASMHPLLFRRLYTDELLREMSKKIMGEPEYVDANREFIFEDMQVMTDFELNSLCEKFPKTIGAHALDEQKWLDSGKVTKLLEVVRAVIERKEKVLVFSLFTQMLDVLEKILSFANITFLRLDGQTSVDTRQDIIDRFYEDETIPVFLLSTKAGGFGINLVAANNVVIFDQSFNPHDDKQAEDRAHRVGQEREVLVTKLISQNTIDENILMLAENKLQLDHSISNEQNESKFEEKAATMFEKLLFEN